MQDPFKDKSIPESACIPNNHVTLFKARLALMDYKGKFIDCFAQTEASLWSFSTDLTQRVVVSEFCENMMLLLADLNDQFLLNKNDYKDHVSKSG